MKRRCHSETDDAYPNYGGRGIKVCDQWRNSFAAFLADMGERPSPWHTLDRIDNDGNYEPGNVRWALRADQNRNTRKNLMLTYNGKTQHLSAWAKETGLKREAIAARLRRGLSVKDALTKPVK